MVKEKVLRYLIRNHPELCAEIFCEDFVGMVAKRQVDHNSLRFLQKNSTQLEPWLLMMNHQLQREQTLYGHKLRNPGFYEGAMFILKLLYGKVIRYVPKKTAETAPVLTTINPFEGVEAFEKGIKDNKNGQKSDDTESETSQV